MRKSPAKMRRSVISKEGAPSAEVVVELACRWLWNGSLLDGGLFQHAWRSLAKGGDPSAVASATCSILEEAASMMNGVPGEENEGEVGERYERLQIVKAELRQTALELAEQSKRNATLALLLFADHWLPMEPASGRWERLALELCLNSKPWHGLADHSFPLAFLAARRTGQELELAMSIASSSLSKQAQARWTRYLWQSARQPWHPEECREVQ